MSHGGLKRKKTKLFPEIIMGDNSPETSESPSGGSGPDDTDDGDGGISDGSQPCSRLPPKRSAIIYIPEVRKALPVIKKAAFNY